MLILLPPSETKATGGTGAPLNLDQLSFPELNPVRHTIAQDLQALTWPQAGEVLGISEKLQAEAAANNELCTQATMPALLRYTGVLYEALDPASLNEQQRGQLAIGSALFGVVGANDAIPRYRLSAGTKLPDSTTQRPTMKRRWGKLITQALEQRRADGEFIVDLRSGGYQQLGPLPQAPSLRVESVQADGSRKVISHNNKHYKGLVVGALLRAGLQPTDLPSLAEALQSLGYTIELPADAQRKPELTLVVTPQ